MNILHNIWCPTSVRGGGGVAGVGAGVIEFTFISSMKFIGRTITLGLGVALSTIAFKTLSNTNVGINLGLKTLLGKISSSCQAVTIADTVIGVIALGALSSFVIEKYGR